MFSEATDFDTSLYSLSFLENELCGIVNVHCTVTRMKKQISDAFRLEGKSIAKRFH